MIWCPKDGGAIELNDGPVALLASTWSYTWFETALDEPDDVVRPGHLTPRRDVHLNLPAMHFNNFIYISFTYLTPNNSYATVQ